jgi:hypothetical protein
VQFNQCHFNLLVLQLFTQVCSMHVLWQTQHCCAAQPLPVLPCFCKLAMPHSAALLTIKEACMTNPLHWHATPC